MDIRQDYNGAIVLGYKMIDNIRKMAADREKLHKNHASSRPLSKDYEYIGLKGEEKFAEEFNLVLDGELKPGGDKGHDFSSSLGAIDIKTARKAYNLIVEEGKVRADVYVLAQYEDYTDSVKLLGWASKDEVLEAPVRDFGYGIMNHYIPKNDLHHMDFLKGQLK